MAKVFFITSVLTVFVAMGGLCQKRALLSTPFHSDLKAGHVSEFLDELNSRTNMIVQYASNIVDANKTVALDGTETTIGAFLKKVLTGQRVKLLEKNNKLLLVKSETVINTDDLVPTFTVYGFVKEESSKEPLIGATVIETSAHKGIATNAFGYFSLSLPEGKHRIAISYIGFTTRVLDLTLTNDIRTDVELSVKQEEAILQVIVVPATEGIKKNGANVIRSHQYDSYNYLMGENDPIRSAYLLPGVKNIPSSYNGMFVRGGGSDENMFIMDGNVVFNPTHMMGALSIVNPTSMKSMQLFKSDFPSKYAGATSSVINIHTKDGNMESWHGETEVGTLSGSITLEGPVAKNKTAVMGSFRHSWTTPMLNLFHKGVNPDFFDVHFKATQLLNDNNKLMVNFYNGKDEMRQAVNNIDNLNKWGNLLGSLTWNRVIGSRSFVNTTAGISRYKNLGAYKYTFTDVDDNGEIESESEAVSTLTSTELYVVKSEGEIYLSNRAKLNLGIDFSHIIIKPFETKVSADIDEDEHSFTSFKPLPYDELSAYAEGEFRLSKNFFIRPGLHVSGYQFKDYRYLSFQPRFFTSYRINSSNQVYASFGRMMQYLHLVTNPFVSLNADMWVPSTPKLQPEQSDIYNVGYAYDNGKGWKASVEGYWKKLQNVTDYTEGKSYFAGDDNWEQNVNTGNGLAYGLEWMVRKDNDKLSLLSSYTLAWSWRQFDDINQGKRFPYKYDRRHTINIGAGYHITSHFDVSALWSFSSGDAFSLPDQVYPDFDQSQQISNPDDILQNHRAIYTFSKYNQNRSSNYYRLDAAINYHTKLKDEKNLIITSGVYNILRSPDQYIYELKGSATANSYIKEDGFKTFDLTPYISITFKF